MQSNKIDKAIVLGSDKLATGLARSSLRYIDTRVQKARTVVTKIMTQAALSGPVTRKGAKRLGKRLNKAMSGLTLGAVQLDGKDEILYAWVVPEVTSTKQLRIGTITVIVSNKGEVDINSVTSLVISAHAFGRLLQRGTDILDLHWGTVKAQLIYPLFLLWPVLLASKELGNKQFALPGPNGLFIGTIDDGSSVLNVNTFIKFPVIPRWMMLAQAYDRLLEKLEEITRGEEQKMDAVFTACASGIATKAVRQAYKVLVMYMKDRDFDWLREPYQETDSGLIIPNSIRVSQQMDS